VKADWVPIHAVSMVNLRVSTIRYHVRVTSSRVGLQLGGKQGKGARH